jgi:hypothetical protein
MASYYHFGIFRLFLYDLKTDGDELLTYILTSIFRLSRNIEICDTTVFNLHVVRILVDYKQNI